MQKASREARRARAAGQSRDLQPRASRPGCRPAGASPAWPALCALLLGSWLHPAAVAQPVPVEVTATQHWVLYARLHGGEPFAVADSDPTRGRLWWFDAHGRPTAVTRLSPARLEDKDACDLFGRQGWQVMLPATPSTDVAGAGALPAASPGR